MKDKEFKDLKKELFPIELQDYFAKNREVFDNNIEKFENVMDEIKKWNTSDELKTIINYILDSLQNSHRTESELMNNNEMAYFGCFLLRKQYDQMEKTLKKQGITIERIVGYEKGLRFVDDYIKHHSDGNEI